MRDYEFTHADAFIDLRDNGRLLREGCQTTQQEELRCTIDEGGKPRFSLEEHLQMQAIAEGIYLLIGDFYSRLYRLHDDLKVRWATWTRPRFFYPNREFSTQFQWLVMDAQGHPYVGFYFADSQIPGWEAWNEEFNDHIAADPTRLPLLIQRFSPADGRQELANTFSPAVSTIRGFQIVDNHPILGVTQEDEQREVRLLGWIKTRFSSRIKGEGFIEKHKTYFLQKNHQLETVVGNSKGETIFVSNNDFDQAKWGGSVISFSQAFILKIDKEGNQVAYQPLRGPRKS